MQQQKLPDDERREELNDLRDQLKRAHSALPGNSEGADVVSEDHLGSIHIDIKAAIADVDNALDEIPEWDDELVRDIVLENVPRRETSVERVDGEIVHRFEAGDIGGETEFRYAIAVTTGNEWLHIKAEDGGWNEVWRN